MNEKITKKNFDKNVDKIINRKVIEERVRERLESYKKKIQQISKIYNVEKERFSENYQGVNQHPINYELLRNLYKKFYNLVGVLYKKEIIGNEFGKKPLNYDANWADFKSIFQIFINTGILSPISFYESPFRRIIKEGEDLVKKIKITYPDLHESADEILITANEILNEKAAPYIDEIRKKNLDKRINNIVLSRNFKKRKEFENITNIVYENIKRIFSSGVNILFDTKLRDTQIYDNLLVIGPPPFFEDHVFSRPKTLELHSMCYDFCFKKPKTVSGFIQPFKIKERSQFRPIIIKDEINLSAIEEEKIDFNELHSSIMGKNISGEHGQDRNCRLAKLANNKIVYLCNHEGIDTRQDVVVSDEKGKFMVRKVNVDDIETGMHVVLRTQGASYLLVELADKFLGEKKDLYRGIQKNWKKNLMDSVEERGMDNVLEFLKNNGASSNVSKSYVRRWMNDDARSMAPEEKDNFKAFLALTNEQGKIDEYWKAILTIRGKHRTARSASTKKLDRAIQETPTEELDKNLFMVGYQRFSIEGAGSKEAYRIEEISSDNITVKSSLVDFPFELDKN